LVETKSDNTPETILLLQLLALINNKKPIFKKLLFGKKAFKINKLEVRLP
jgi:hypothetical protein